MGLNTIRRSNKIKKVRFAITNGSLKDLSKIIKEFEDLPYGGYVRKRYQHMPNGSYFYLSRQLAKCTTRSNLCVGPVKTQMTNTQNMNNSEMGTQKIPNSNVCSLDESE